MLHPIDSRPFSRYSGSPGDVSHHRILIYHVLNIQDGRLKRVCGAIRDSWETSSSESSLDSFSRARETSKKIGHCRLLQERHHVGTWREYLQDYAVTYGMARMKEVGLSWDAIVQLCWIAAYAELDTVSRGRFSDALISFVGKKVDAEGCGGLSPRLSLSIISAGQKLDGSGHLVKELVSTLDTEYSRFNKKQLVQFMSIMMLSNATDQRFTKVFSENIEHGLLQLLNPMEFQSVLNNMARIKWAAPLQQKKRILDCALKMSKHLDNENIVSLVQIMTRMPHVSRTDMDAVSQVVSSAMEAFAMKELGLIAKQYAILYTRDYSDEVSSSMLGMIAQHAAQCVDGADPKDVVRLIQAFQMAHFKPDALLDVLDIWADKRLASMNAHGISLAMTHFARVGEASPRLLQTAVSVIESNLDQLTASDASKLVWAFAHLGYYPGKNLLGKCLKYLQSPATVGDFSDREMANLFWGLVKLEHYPSMNERALIASSLYSHPGRVSGQSSALLLWSFACSHEAMGGAQDDRCFDNTLYRLGLEVCKDVLLVDSQSISMTSWSFGVLKLAHIDFAKSLNTLASEGRLHMFDPQHISNLIWGLAKSGSRPSDEFLLEVMSVLSGKLSTYSPQELFNVCWSFATLRFHAPSVTAETITELKARSTEFQGLELSGIAWSLSRMLDIERDHVLSEKACLILQREICKHIDELEMSQLAMALVGLARLSSQSDSECLRADVVDALLEKISDCMNQKNYTISSINTILEGMVLISPSVPTSIVDTIEYTISDAILDSAKLWEVCDLCYYTCEVGIMWLAARLLEYIEERVMNGERLTPRASIMLLHTMTQCNTYPAETLHLTTSKLRSMSPKYRISNKWLKILAETRPKLAENANIVLSFHPDWEDRLHALLQQTE